MRIAYLCTIVCTRPQLRSLPAHDVFVQRRQAIAIEIQLNCVDDSDSRFVLASTQVSELAVCVSVVFTGHYSQRKLIVVGDLSSSVCE